MAFIFHFIYGIFFLPIDELIFFKMVKTTNQLFLIFLIFPYIGNVLQLKSIQRHLSGHETICRYLRHYGSGAPFS